MMQTEPVGRLDPALDAETKAIYRDLAAHFLAAQFLAARSLATPFDTIGDGGFAMTEAARIPAHQRGVHFEEMAGESLLFNEANQKTIYLNEAASAIWKLCDGTRSVGELIHLLEQAYADPAHDFAGDVHATLDNLFTEGVLRWIDGGEGRDEPPA